MCVSGVARFDSLAMWAGVRIGGWWAWRGNAAKRAAGVEKVLCEPCLRFLKRTGVLGEQRNTSP